MTAAYRDKTVKAVATLNSFTDGRRWMRMGMGNDKYNKMLRTLRRINGRESAQEIRFCATRTNSIQILMNLVISM